MLRTPQALPSVMQLGTDLHHYPVCIEEDARARHLYLVGATGSGKTSLAENMIAQDLRENRGLCFIDPHGDAAPRVIGLIPNERRDHLVYIDLSDPFPVGLNFLSGIPPRERPTAAANLVATFIHIYGEQAVGPRSQQVFRNAVRALMDTQGATLIGMKKLLTNDAYRGSILRRCKDPVVRFYWQHEFPEDLRRRDEVISPLMNKLDAFLSYESLRCILGQTSNTIELRKIMDEGRILIVNLAKGAVGEPALIFGAMLLSALTQTALSRANVPERERLPFYVYCDEFQGYSTPAISEALSELRKYRLYLILAHQYLHQVPEGVLKAIIGNAASLISFRIGADDSPFIAQHFDIANSKALQDLPNYRAYLRPLVHGAPGTALLFQTPPPPRPHQRRERAMMRNSQVRFAPRHRREIEKKIASFLARKDSRPVSPSKRRIPRARKIA